MSLRKLVSKCAGQLDVTKPASVVAAWRPVLQAVPGASTKVWDDWTKLTTGTSQRISPLDIQKLQLAWAGHALACDTGNASPTELAACVKAGVMAGFTDTAWYLGISRRLMDHLLATPDCTATQEALLWLCIWQHAHPQVPLHDAQGALSAVLTQGTGLRQVISAGLLHDELLRAYQHLASSGSSHSILEHVQAVDQLSLPTNLQQLVGSQQHDMPRSWSALSLQLWATHSLASHQQAQALAMASYLSLVHAAQTLPSAALLHSQCLRAACELVQHFHHSPAISVEFTARYQALAASIWVACTAPGVAGDAPVTSSSASQLAHETHRSAGVATLQCPWWAILHPFKLSPALQAVLPRDWLWPRHATQQSQARLATPVRVAAEYIRSHGWIPGVIVPVQHMAKDISAPAGCRILSQAG